MPSFFMLPIWHQLPDRDQEHTTTHVSTHVTYMSDRLPFVTVDELDVVLYSQASMHN
jgi:hypothetical protein